MGLASAPLVVRVFAPRDSGPNAKHEPWVAVLQIIPIIPNLFIFFLPHLDTYSSPSLFFCRVPVWNLSPPLLPSSSSSLCDAFLVQVLYNKYKKIFQDAVAWIFQDGAGEYYLVPFHMYRVACGVGRKSRECPAWSICWRGSDAQLMLLNDAIGRL